MNDLDLSLAPDPTAAQPDADAHDHAAITAAAIDSLAEAAVKPLSVSEILEHGRRVERTARICIRGDLQGRYDELLIEINEMVDVRRGEIVDMSMADGDGPSPAQAKLDELEDVRREMAGAMRYVRFRAMPSDKWPTWDEQHRPKGDDPDLTDYNTALIAACAIEPRLSIDEVNEMRGVLGNTQMVELANKAWQANTTGGIDIPKSLGSLQSRMQR